MKIPRNLSGGDLIKRLKLLGYEVSRQTGSHVRLTTQRNGEHHIVPNHSSIKIGTLSAILSEVAVHFNKSKDEISGELFS